ncbi:MAG: alpha-ketoglutarate-dependent dioxygenase AlkB [Gordonia sp. (in: high G+C Gram-positive bacteria)]
MESLFDDLRPGLPAGAHHVPRWLPPHRQRQVVARCARWQRGPVGLHSPRIRGHEMSVKLLCLGWHWRPYGYTRTAVDVNGMAVPPVPGWLVQLGREALGAATGDPRAGAQFTPDVALVNVYDDAARMGMHQDRDEISPAPVVSLSIGDTATFRFGNTESRNRPYTDIALGSGDLFVFGGAARLAYHGVTRVHPGTAPAGCGLAAGRINITLRETGLAG